MAKKLIRYLLEGDGSVPTFVEDGGYVPLGQELIGRSVDDSVRHLPVTVGVMSRADLIARMTTVGIRDFQGNLLDSEGIEEAANALLNHLGLADLA